MTVDTVINRTQTDGDGVKTNFPYSFKIDKVADLSVYFTVKATTVMTTLVEGTDYSVNDIGEDNGTIDLLATGANPVARDWTVDPPESTEDILCIRQPDLLQAKVYKRQGNYRATDVEDGIDYAMMCLQMVDEAIDRCLKVQESSDTDPADLTLETFAGSAPIATANFNGILSATENTVQKALDVLDDDAASQTDLATAVAALNLRVPVLLAEEVASASATLDLVSADVVNHDILELELIALRPATDGTGLKLQYSNNLGSTWQNSLYAYKQILDEISSSHPDYTYSSGSAAAIYLVPDGSYDVGSGTTEIVNGVVRIYGHTGATPLYYCKLISDLLYGDAAVDEWRCQVTGFKAGTPIDVDGFRIAFEAGNITSGTVRLWGLPKGS